MFPSKISPTNSPFLLIVGEPEFPPIMSSVETKLKGVFRSTADFFSSHRGGKLYGNSDLNCVERAYRPPSVVKGATFLPFSIYPLTARYARRKVKVAPG